MPWQGETTEGDKARGDYKYQYHPGGNPKNPPKDAPSALHSVIVPNVNLPKVRNFLYCRMFWYRETGAAEVDERV